MRESFEYVFKIAVNELPQENPALFYDWKFFYHYPFYCMPVSSLISEEVCGAGLWLNAHHVPAKDPEVRPELKTFIALARFFLIPLNQFSLHS